MSKEFVNPNFNLKVQKAINSHAPLADWFNRNVFDITYYELSEPHVESNFSPINSDMITLERMSNIALCWLESELYTDLERAVMATLAISKIYEESKDRLSDKAKEAFKIDSIGLTLDSGLASDIDISNPPKWVQLQVEYLKAKREKAELEIQRIEAQLAQLQPNDNKKVM